MPKQLTQKDLESGAQVIKKAVAVVASAPAGADMVEVLKEVQHAIQKMVSLQAMTKALIEKPIVQQDTSEILDRLAEIQFLTQQTMESMSTAMVDAVKGFRTPIPTPKPRSIEMTVTERDAWGRIKAIKANLEA